MRITVPSPGRLSHLLAGILFLNAQMGLGQSLPPLTTGFDHSHARWASILKDRVRVRGAGSRVDYKGLKAHPEPLWAYIQDIESLSLNGFKSFSEAQRLAFLINAYNALTLKLVVSKYPLKSIKDLGSFFSSPWKKTFFSLFGARQHLDHIEHELIRKHFNEPRIHFAVNCASIGCPPLHEEPFVAERLEEQLEAATRRFLGDPSQNRYDPKSKRLELSSIFKWYGEDFPKKYGTLLAFLAPRITSNPEHQKSLLAPGVKISYLEYDWALNEEK